MATCTPRVLRELTSVLGLTPSMIMDGGTYPLYPDILFSRNCYQRLIREREGPYTSRHRFTGTISIVELLLRVRTKWR